MAKECTTPYEKGDKEKGNSGGAGLKGGGWKGAKGGGKGDNKGGKKGGGKGKGYQGTCFDCGKVGHKRGEWECPMAGGKGGGIHEVECGQVAVSIGGGGMEWNVGSVEIVQEDEEEQVVDPREVVCE